MPFCDVRGQCRNTREPGPGTEHDVPKPPEAEFKTRVEVGMRPRPTPFSPESKFARGKHPGRSILCT
jgi:hypothetical protein